MRVGIRRSAGACCWGPAPGQRCALLGLIRYCLPCSAFMPRLQCPAGSPTSAPLHALLNLPTDWHLAHLLCSACPFNCRCCAGWC